MDAIPSIAENFEAYRTVEMPHDPPGEVVDFVRAAFFAGAGSTLRNIEIIKRTADSPAMGIAAIAALETEVAEFGLERVTKFIADQMEERFGPGITLLRITRVE